MERQSEALREKGIYPGMIVGTAVDPFTPSDTPIASHGLLAWGAVKREHGGVSDDHRHDLGLGYHERPSISG